MAKDRHYNIPKIRQLLLSSFQAENLQTFLSDRPIFRPIREELPIGGSLASWVETVIIYCQQRGLFPKLLAEMRECNRHQYVRYAPYIVEPNVDEKPVVVSSLADRSETLTPSISKEQAGAQVRKWARWEIWIRRSARQEILAASHLVTFRSLPVVLYMGKCKVWYETQQHKDAGTVGKVPNILNRSELVPKNKRPHELRICWPIVPDDVPIDGKDRALAQRIAQSVCGDAATFQYDWPPIDKLTGFFKNPFERVMQGGKWLVCTVWSSVGESVPVWPKLDIATRRLKTGSSQSGSTVRRGYGAALPDFESTVCDKVGDILRERILEAIHRPPALTVRQCACIKEESCQFLFPFWVAKTGSAEDQVVVISGITGKVVHANAPTGLAARVAVGLLVAVLIVGIAALVAAVASS